MTSRERLLKTLRHQEPDRVPFDLSSTPVTGIHHLAYRWLRGVWIGLGEGVPLRYIILYFCAAELMPVLLAVHAWRGTSTE